VDRPGERSTESGHLSQREAFAQQWETAEDDEINLSFELK